MYEPEERQERESTGDAAAAPRPFYTDGGLNVETYDARTAGFDTLSQTLRERWRFTESTSSGTVVRREEEILELRWTYRYEMRYLLELGGLAIEGEFSDFGDSPPAYGREQIWVAVTAH